MPNEMMDQQITVRIPPSLVPRAEKVLEAMKEDSAIRMVGRLTISSVWRSALDEGLAELEKHYGLEPSDK